ncbi:hypothetical protein MMC07_002842 [Pseudocyphellaria aurata]|nr:hypothetical protein [Pseudocyphellaria aurata]
MANFSRFQLDLNQDLGTEHQTIKHRKKQEKACDQCRGFKRKCEPPDGFQASPNRQQEEGLLKCKNCERSSIECTWGKVIPKGDASLKKIADLLETLAENTENGYGELTVIFGGIERNVANINKHLSGGVTNPLNAPVPMEHTTAAHRLLQWPSIQKLMEKSTRKLHYSEDYVMELEKAKGILRVYGRGEGSDYGNRAQPSHPTKILTSRIVPEIQFPTSVTDDLWGSGFADVSSDGEIGGLTRDGMLAIDPPTLRRLLESYMKNIHILHPFLSKDSLHQLVESFSAYHNPDYQQGEDHTLSSTNVTGASASRPQVPQGRKRKHKNDQDLDPLGEGSTVRRPQKSRAALSISISTADPNPGEEGFTSLGGSRSRVALQKSMSTAIVLLVIALGKICEWKYPLPGPIDTDKMEGAFHPPESSSASIKDGSLLTKQMTNKSLRKAMNVNVIPGLAYYAHATGTLRVGVGYRLHAEPVNTSPSLKNEENAHADLIRFAFWTCLQLESDILAELDLPRSGMQNVPDVSHPIGLNDPNSARSMVMFCYSGQVLIRNILNNIQINLHPAKDAEIKTSVTPLRDEFHQTLQRWRELLPLELQWQEEENPSADINKARLRAKYYGALYIVHRPFLRDILDFEIGSKKSPPLASLEVMAASAKICVDAAMKSTVAFDNIVGRLIVTNIFGTAHAQFGNVMVLAATYKSRLLNHLVPRETLESLLNRTIEFLRLHSNISSTLDQDANILELIREVVFAEV